MGAFVALAPWTVAHAQSQAELAKSCQAEIQKAERSIEDARKKPEFKSDKGRLNLTSADRYLNQARTHAEKGESRNCATVAQKSRAQLSAR